MSVHTVTRTVFAVLCAAMLGLAAGAVWMVAALYARHPTPWLALPVAVVLAWTIRQWVQSPGRFAALLAAVAALLAALYVHLLMAGALIAANMGMGIVEALRTAGASMLLHLARLGFSMADAGWCLAAAVLAAILASRRARNRSYGRP
jgi:vitamin B12 transport system permease protein